MHQMSFCLELSIPNQGFIAGELNNTLRQIFADKTKEALLLFVLELVVRDFQSFIRYSQIKFVEMQEKA